MVARSTPASLERRFPAVLTTLRSGLDSAACRANPHPGQPERGNQDRYRDSGLLDDAVRQHRVRHLLEAGDVRPPHVVDVRRTGRLAVFDAALVDALHDLDQEFADLVLGPRDT